MSDFPLPPSPPKPWRNPFIRYKPITGEVAGNLLKCKPPHIQITQHDAKIIASMLRGYANIVKESPLNNSEDAGVRLLLIDEHNQAVEMRGHLLGKIAALATS